MRVAQEGKIKIWKFRIAPGGIIWMIVQRCLRNAKVKNNNGNNFLWRAWIIDYKQSLIHSVDECTIALGEGETHTYTYWIETTWDSGAVGHVNPDGA